MGELEIAKIADLLRERNVIDDAIAKIIGRPMTSGHLGEWIAAQIFDIALEARSYGARDRWPIPKWAASGPDGQRQVVPQAGGAARYDGVAGPRFLSSADWPEISGCEQSLLDAAVAN
jgi:hypothetical protein